MFIKQLLDVMWLQTLGVVFHMEENSQSRLFKFYNLLGVSSLVARSDVFLSICQCFGEKRKQIGQFMTPLYQATKEKNYTAFSGVILVRAEPINFPTYDARAILILCSLFLYYSYVGYYPLSNLRRHYNAIQYKIQTIDPPPLHFNYHEESTANQYPSYLSLVYPTSDVVLKLSHKGSQYNPCWDNILTATSHHSLASSLDKSKCSRSQ